MSKLVSLAFISANSRFDSEKPYIISEMPELDIEKQSNIEVDLHNDIPITDGRGQETNFTLEENSFEWVTHSFSSVVNDSDEASMEYAQECVNFLQARLGADRVICYDIVKRHNISSVPYKAVSKIAGLPATIVHMDNSRSDGPLRIKRHLTADEAAEYMSGKYRMRIINMWRPLRVVKECPLALCDSRTIPRSSLVPGDLVTPSTLKENCWVRYHSDMRWYWLSNQMPDEATLFLQFDSHATEQSDTKYCAHAAFLDPTIQLNSHPRQSVEVRAIVINRLTEGN
ncbi:hypothetical protein BKA64DRAFT_708644 [Cadophora sp. MPI-SDFR-AT-0126]|nr:hypothetical protein BKA64DRAFT_708644 [Leotiomycetes sp. MPI-SDFR-AT-0126]